MIRKHPRKVRSYLWNLRHSDQQAPASPQEKKKALGHLLWRKLYESPKQLRLPVIEFLDIQYKEKPMGFHFPCHRHSRFMEFYYVDRGEVTLIVEGKKIPLAAQQGVLIPLGKLHEIQGTDRVSTNILTLHFLSPDLARLFPGFKALMAVALSLSATTRESLRSFLESLNQSDDKQFLRAGIGFLNFLLLLSTDERQKTRKEFRPKETKSLSPFAQKVEKAIVEHLHEKLSLRLMAQQMGTSISGLAHLYRQGTGETVKKAILRCRMEKAKVLLREGRLSVKEIANLVGFKTSSAFSTVFRKMEGATPGDYQRSLGPES